MRRYGKARAAYAKKRGIAPSTLSFQTRTKEKDGARRAFITTLAEMKTLSPLHTASVASVLDEVRIPDDSAYYTLTFLLLALLRHTDTGALRIAHDNLLAGMRALTLEYENARDELAPPSPQVTTETLSAIVGAYPLLFGEGDAFAPILRTRAGDYYLHKNQSFEGGFIDALATFLGGKDVSGNASNIVSSVRRALATETYDVSDEQARAMRLALEKRFLVVVGGPGTGKTATVVNMLRAILTERKQRGADPATYRVAIAAPTGRAAVRIVESIRAAKYACPYEQAIDDALPDEGVTLHKLLGITISSNYLPRYSRERPLPLDALVVDEASMVDVRLMTYLFSALSPSAKLILVGDSHQLPSVEAGAVLNNLVVGAEDATHRLHEHVTHLTKNFRAGNEDLRELAMHINEGSGAKTLSFLNERKGEGGNVRYVHAPEGRGGITRFVEKFVSYPFAAIAERAHLPLTDEGGACRDDATETLRTLFAFFNESMILSATREGEGGIENVNAHFIARARGDGAFYPGMPLMITRNDYLLRLWNGDRGVIVFDETTSSLKAVFPFYEAKDGKEFRAVHPARLSAYTPAYAITVHKSQGSEFRNVVLLLTQHDSPLYTREILYTGVTRAKERAVIVSRDKVIRQTVSRVIERPSGISAWLTRDA